MSDHITSEKDERLWSHTSEYSLGVKKETFALNHYVRSRHHKYDPILPSSRVHSAILNRAFA